MKTITQSAGEVVVNEDGATWTMPVSQFVKHQPMFSADVAALPKADRDQLAELIAADAIKAVR